MKYVALLRGINVGTARHMDMKKLKGLFEALGFKNVSTYINSGNVLFESGGKTAALRGKIEKAVRKEFGFEVPALVKTIKEMKAIAAAVPKSWKNDGEQRTDVAYLFPEIDSKKTVEKLPFNREVVDARYVKGAVIWNLDRKFYGRSRLNKLIGHELYQYMTMRNVNTARFLAK